jgi:hypothetical protein
MGLEDAFRCNVLPTATHNPRQAPLAMPISNNNNQAYRMLPMMANGHRQLQVA